MASLKLEQCYPLKEFNDQNPSSVANQHALQIFPKTPVILLSILVIDCLAVGMFELSITVETILVG